MHQLARAWSMPWRLLLIVSALIGLPMLVRADQATPVDPLNSPSWYYVRAHFFDQQKLVFDERVQVFAPKSAEDPLDVPVMIKANELPDVEEIVIIADLNPIQKILTYTPKLARPELSFRFKIEQSTPIRAAVRTRDGVWHLGGTWISAAGGGCTTPSGGSSGLWQGHLGEVSARVWENASPTANSQRLRLRVIHPMDTGLAKGVPVFYIDRITLRREDGAELATVQPFEPISENPVLSFDLQNDGPVRVEGRDIQGNTFSATVTP